MDHPDAVQRFISKMKAQREHSAPVTAPSPSVIQHDWGVMTPPRSCTISGERRDHEMSPEDFWKPSPSLAGLKAPHNTPKTAASSPRLTAGNTHNEDVAEALSDYVSTLDGRPLSDSMWAPGSAGYKSSKLSGRRSTSNFSPVKFVEPNPAINDTFDRMSFKAADPDYKNGKSLIGDHNTKNLFSNAQPSFVNKFSVLENKSLDGKVEAVQANSEVSEEDFETPAHFDSIAKTQSGTDGASKTDFKPQTDPIIERDTDAPSASKANVAPHLRAMRASSQKSDSSTRVPAPETSEGQPSEQVQTSQLSVPSPPVINTEVKSKVHPVGAQPLKDKSVNEDLEHKTFFNAWPKLEARDKPAAKVRKVIIKGLPRGSTATFVASLVYGGPVEEIYIRSSTAEDLSAAIRFMDAGDCMKYYDDTSNGLVYEKDAKGRDLVLFVELSKDVDVVGGLLQGWIASGVTRCVRAVGVDADWSMDALVKIAERKNRKVEKIVDGQNAGGARSVVFRFCKVDDAVQFKAALSRDEEWEHCNIHYATDPCATASGVHLND